MENKDYETDSKKRLENMFASTGKEKVGEEVKEEHSFKKKEGEDTYSYKVEVSKTREPRDKLDELTMLVQDIGDLSPFWRMKSKKGERINDLLKEVSEDYLYRKERKVGQDHYIYTRRIGEECDVLINAEGKMAYTHLNLKGPAKPFFNKDIYRVLVQKKEVKKLGRAFWAVEEGCFMGTYAQRFLSYAGVTAMATMTGVVYGFCKAGYFLGVNMPAYAAVGMLSALIGVGAVHARHIIKQKKIFKKHAPNIVYNKEALEKAFKWMPHKGMIQENPH